MHSAGTVFQNGLAYVMSVSNPSLAANRKTAEVWTEERTNLDLWVRRALVHCYVTQKMWAQIRDSVSPGNCKPAHLRKRNRTQKWDKKKTLRSHQSECRHSFRPAAITLMRLLKKARHFLALLWTTASEIRITGLIEVITKIDRNLARLASGNNLNHISWRLGK